MWLSTTISGVEVQNPTTTTDPNHWIDVGLSIARTAVRQSDAVEEGGEALKNDAAHAYQWLAIFLGLSASSPATGVSQRIQLGHEFEVNCYFCFHHSLNILA